MCCCWHCAKCVVVVANNPNVLLLLAALFQVCCFCGQCSKCVVGCILSVLLLLALFQMCCCCWQCSKSCGVGVKTREIKCMDENQQVVNGCLTDKRPETRKECNTTPCPARTHADRQRPVYRSQHDST